MIIKLTDLCAAVAGQIKQAEGVKRVMTPEQFRENIPDLPLVQVYPETIEGSGDSGNDRSTFQAGVRERQFVLFIDAFARTRSYIGEDMQKVLEITDAIIDILDRQKTAPFFNLEGIKSLKWRGERALINYNEKEYMGMRFTLTLEVY